jgi:O-antigen/teichoic acid export membrane protein
MPGASLTASFLRQAAFTSVAQILVIATGIAGSVVLARALGPSGRGVLAIAVLLGSFVSYGASLGLGQAATYYLSRRVYPTGVVVGQTVLSAAVLSAAGLGVGIVVIETAGEALFRGVPPQLLYMGLLLAPPQIFFGFVAAILLGLGEIALYNMAQLVRAATWMGAIAMAVLGPGASVALAITAEILSFGLVSTILVARLTLSLRPHAMAWHHQYLVSSARFGVASYLGTSLNLVNQRGTVFLLNGLSNPAAVGLFVNSHSGSSWHRSFSAGVKQNTN